MTRGAVQHWFDGKTQHLTAENYRMAAYFFGVSREWLETGKGPARVEGSGNLEVGTFEQLQTDWSAMPEGLKYYICKKARDIRTTSDAYPEWFRKTLRPIKDESDYRDWETSIEAAMASGKLFFDTKSDINPRERK